MGIYYGETFFNSNQLKKAAQVYLDNLPLTVTYLLSQGRSGCSIASAMLSLSERELHHICINKKDENSHGQSGNDYTPKRSVYVIVDDFIESGETIRHLLSIAQSEDFDVFCILVSSNGTDGVGEPLDFGIEVIELTKKLEKAGLYDGY
jgi:orotate phosphoribosyltransferase